MPRNLVSIIIALESNLKPGMVYFQHVFYHDYVFRVVWANLGLLCVHRNLKSVLSGSLKTYVGILVGIALNL